MLFLFTITLDVANRDKKCHISEMIDQVGENIQASNASWSFGDTVPKSFSEHVKKSVPRYQEGHELILKLSDFFIKKDSCAYDLGTSTGALVKKLAQRHSDSVRWVGVDQEPEMLAQAKREVKAFDSSIDNIEFLCEDLIHCDFEKSDFITSYYTIQFTAPKNRGPIIDRIYDSLNWGGAFLLFEKVRGADARFQDIFTSLYQDYKLEQGYGPSEILAKSRSLKGVLEPFSSQGNLDLLKRAGFVDIQPVFRSLCFEGVLAIK